MLTVFVISLGVCFVGVGLGLLSERQRLGRKGWRWWLLLPFRIVVDLLEAAGQGCSLWTRGYFYGHDNEDTEPCHRGNLGKMVK